MLSSFQNVAARRCIKSFVGIWAKCSAGLRFKKESKVEEGHLMPDHVHMLLSIPPKYAVSQVVGFIKGKSAIHMARVYGERKRNFVGQHFWARGFFVNTVGRDEEAIRAYIRNQEKEDQRLEQMNLWR
jgi:putative transposase